MTACEIPPQCLPLLDPSVVAASLVPVTQRVELLVALRTSLGSPDLPARGKPPRSTGFALVRLLFECCLLAAIHTSWLPKRFFWITTPATNTPMNT